MNQVDLEDLITQSTEQAKLMAERARKGLEGLSLIERTTGEAAHKLESDVAHTRSVIAATTKLLDSMQSELDKRDGDVHKALITLDHDSSRVEKDVATASDTLRTANAALVARADDSARLLKQKLLSCQKEVEGLKAFAGNELVKLRTYTSDVAALIVALQGEATAIGILLDQALKTLMAEHAALDKAFEAQLVAMETAYNQAVAATDKRLGELETEIDKVTQTADSHLDEVLVQKLATELRKAADTFASDLTAIEKEVTKIVNALGEAHTGFRTNLTVQIQPKIAEIASGLYRTAQNLQWV